MENEQPPSATAAGVSDLVVLSIADSRIRPADIALRIWKHR